MISTGPWLQSQSVTGETSPGAAQQRAERAQERSVQETRTAQGTAPELSGAEWS